MYFGALPPEVNSANMYAGAGADSMYAAANDWQDLASELNIAATGFDGVFCALQREWLGPTAIRMAEAALPYKWWLWAVWRHVIVSAKQTLILAEAYEAAFEMTVPPEYIAWNRAELQTLIADNAFGQNVAAIAGLEEQYDEFWAQDVEAMDTYATRALDALSAVTPFKTAPQITGELRPVPEAVAVSSGSATTPSSISPAW
ncbi:PPE family protein [Mycobacterium haemophilum]|uniref:PPE family protein n=1 Tax=Mycobacterium haemophilum TaxID=29311 RepID=UPI00069C43EB|nr:PPE family protein [Mycobacterium haemophilum]ALL56303.1 hypothetical protein B586_08400 [Mycobacterium haemophilum DSM 44634]MCV7339402.1 PPE family protein [Mycobacterium haemophilum DSM 44634]